MSHPSQIQTAEQAAKEVEMKQLKQLIKRDGTVEPYDVNKIHKMVKFACEGINDVSESELEMKLAPHIKDGMKTSELNDYLVSECKSLIIEGRYNYDIVGGRVISYNVRKEAYGSFEVPKLIDIVKNNVSIGRYDPAIPGMYSEQEWEVINSFIDHSRDELFRLAGASQMRTKYLSKNRISKKICESFQIPFILVPAVLFSKEENRLEKIKEAYDCLSLFDISEPSPIMSGVRTIMKQFSSCVLIDVDDTIDSIAASHHAVLRYVSNKAGLGINVGRNRGKGAPIKNGEAVHTGLIPFIKDLTAGTKSCSQGGMRDGAVTFSFPSWHYEFPELVVLKNNSLPQEQTNLQADYCIQVSGELYKRAQKNEGYPLFSPHDAPGLYEAFFRDQKEFADLYAKYELAAGVRKRNIPARQILNDIVTQRSNTGRIYISNVDHVNNKSSFKVPVYMTNLCVEITLPTTPIQDISDGMPSEISICTLGAVNVGKIKSLSELEKACRVAVRLADAVLDYQDYPVKAARESTLARRPIGIGIIGLAHYLARRGLPYGRIALDAVDQLAEAWSYYLLKASVELAKEKGPCPLWKETKYSDGWTPNLTRTKKLDEILPHKERFDWDSLRADMKKYGIRNSTVMAGMPSETSSQLSNETNGFEPPRAPVVVKGSKDEAVPIVVPEVDLLMGDYDWAWEQRSPQGYLEVAAVFQKYMDQAISVNTGYNPKFFKDGKLNTDVLTRDLIYAWQLGHKNIYYNNVKKPGEDEILGGFEEQAESGCAGGACNI